MRSRGQGSEIAKRLVLIRPNVVWQATIVKVNEDGTADLEIPIPNTGSTANCFGVKQDQTKKKSHTFHTIVNDDKVTPKTATAVVIKKEPDKLVKTEATTGM